MKNILSFINNNCIEIDSEEKLPIPKTKAYNINNVIGELASNVYIHSRTDKAYIYTNINEISGIYTFLIYDKGIGIIDLFYENLNKVRKGEQVKYQKLFEDINNLNKEFSDLSIIKLAFEDGYTTRCSDANLGLGLYITKNSIDKASGSIIVYQKQGVFTYDKLNGFMQISNDNLINNGTCIILYYNGNTNTF